MDVMQATSDDPARSKRHPMRTAASIEPRRHAAALPTGGKPRPSTRDLSGARGPGRSGGSWPTWSACALALVAGCTASAEDVHPQPDVMAFPSGLAITPDEQFLFVANANSELRYDSGSIGVLEVGKIQDAIDGWLATRTTGDCEEEDGHTETLVCPAPQFLKGGKDPGDAGVRIGNFATDIALQDFSPPGGVGSPGPYRVFVPTRGDPSVAWADFVDGALSCNASGDTFALCDDAHRLSTLENDPDLAPLPEEPFGVFADGATGIAMVSHLNNGAVTLIAAPPPPAPGGTADVKIVDVRAGFFNVDVNGTVGATGITARPSTPGGTDKIIYVGSRSDRRVQTFTIGTLPISEPPPAPPPAVAAAPAYLVPGNFFLLTEVGNVVGGSTDTRGMKISDDGNRLYLVNRQPPTLQLYDTSMSTTGAPRNVGLGVIDICRQASTVAVLDNGTGERAYVTCFQDGQLYVVDPRDLSQPEDILLVGRGPYSVVGAAKGLGGRRKLLFVSNFLEDTIAVVNITPGDLTYNRVVLRIGTPRAPSP
jgi:hypothetical protein